MLLRASLLAVLALGASLLFGGLSGIAKAQVYSGEGTAVMGTSMTPEGTQALAFEKARQTALEKFGARVVSEQTVTTVETPSGIDEISTSAVQVLAAGATQLVEGSKTVDRTLTENAVRYRVSARFRIEPTDFGRTVRAYLTTGTDAPLRSSVQDAARLQRQLMQTDTGEADAVRTLLSRTEEAYQQVSAAVQNTAGEAARSNIDRQRRRRANALLRYLRAVKTHGYPGDLLQFDLSGPEVQDEGDLARLTYEVDYTYDASGDLLSSCRDTRPVWARSNRSGRRADGPDLDGWAERLLGEGGTGFEVAKESLLFLIGDNERVVAIKNPGGLFEFKYARCSAEQFLEESLWSNWSDEREILLPIQHLSDVERAVLALSTRKYEEIARRHGFEALGRGRGMSDLYVQAEGADVGLDAFTYSRRQFRADMNKHADAVKEMTSSQ